jgi:hypothetical protein
MVLKSVLLGNNYAMNISMKIAIIGNGIAAWCINKYLRNTSDDLLIHRFGDDSMMPTCSFRTTSINCMRGTKKGISALGDLMVDSMHEFMRFNQHEKSNGIYETFEYQLWDKEDDKFTQRFESYKEILEVDEIKLQRKMLSYKSKAFLIDPYLFYQGLNLEPVKANFVSSLVFKNNLYHLEANGFKEQYDKIILCCGLHNNLFIDLFQNEDAKDFVKRTKPVKGDYLYLQTQHNYASKSLAIKNHHLIFRPNEILIGSTSFNEDATYKIKTKELKKVYDDIINSVRIELPAFNKFQAICGIRAKGRKRMPYWDEVGPNLYMIGGLYKNAFSFSFLAAKDLSHKII